MLSPRLTNCPECANIPSLLKKIDCKLAELGNSLYNNISYMLNQPIPAGDILQLIAYKRILTYKYCNPNYACDYSVAMIASRVIRITTGCVSRCNAPEPCIEVPCNITIIPNPPKTTTTTSTSSSTTTTTTTVAPTTTTTTTAIKYNYTVAGCERQDYFVIAYDGPGILPTGMIVSNGTPECFYILDQTLAIPDVGTIVTLYGINSCSVCINQHTTTTTSSSSSSTTSTSSTSTTTSSSSSTTTTTTTILEPTTTTTTTVECNSTTPHPYPATLIFAVGSGTFTGSLIDACAAAACLQTSTCAPSAILLGNFNDAVPPIGAGFYGATIGECVPPNTTGYHVINLGGTYTVIEMLNGYVLSYPTC